MVHLSTVVEVVEICDFVYHKCQVALSTETLNNYEWFHLLTTYCTTIGQWALVWYGTVCALVSTYLFVASLTKMVRRYWSMFSYVPLAIITFFTGRLRLHWHKAMSRCDIGLCQCKQIRLSKSHTLIGWGVAVGVASHLPIFAYLLPAVVVT